MMEEITISKKDLMQAGSEASANVVVEGIEKGLDGPVITMLTLFCPLIISEIVKILFPKDKGVEEKIKRSIENEDSEH